MNPGILVLLLIGAYAATEDDLEKSFRKAEDELYECVCRDPSDIYVDLPTILMCPMFYSGIEAPLLLEELALTEEVIKAKKCSSRFSYCPTLHESRCVSVPWMEKKKEVTIQLENGTSTTLSYIEDSSCRCDCISN